VPLALERLRSPVTFLFNGTTDPGGWSIMLHANLCAT
jgi:hypothetical protein